jgi:hypothetical protein
MKNLLNISEEEKSRILEMHETATNKHYLNEQPTQQSSKIELFQDSSLLKSIGFYILGAKDSGMGRSYVALKPTSNSKIKCLSTIGYEINSVPNSFTTFTDDGCKAPSLLYTNNSGKNLIKKL